jgi:polysaccharide deacetylase family protein (PEP-CTERM system associated)
MASSRVEMQVKTLHVVSFDVEEHHRIEAASGLSCPPELKTEYARRMEVTTRMLLEKLQERNVKATFFLVGEIAKTHQSLVRDISQAGHEIGSHSWDHQRVHRFKPQEFRLDLMKSKDALEQVIGGPVVGFRAPTFSIVRETGWAIDIMADCGFEYDSSIFPVRHDRYGIPDAPRRPFRAIGANGELIELPLLTYRLAGLNLPVAGGGYFRLFPLAMMRSGIRQAEREIETPNVAMLYFHPWEFDSDQPRLPLGRLGCLRTYIGMSRTLTRLDSLLRGYSFVRAIDAVRALREADVQLPQFKVVPD